MSFHLASFLPHFPRPVGSRGLEKRCHVPSPKASITYVDFGSQEAAAVENRICPAVASGIFLHSTAMENHNG